MSLVAENFERALMHLDAARVNRDLLDFIALEIVGVDFNGLAAIGRFALAEPKAVSRKRAQASGSAVVFKRISNYSFSLRGLKLDFTLL